jgi:NAD(P)-dependent dehydrogenase (short-subunit alcohol dehydrogenase family)
MRSEPEHWAETFQTNVVGGFFMSMAFLPLLVKGHHVSPGYTSSIINTCSNSALLNHTTHGHISYAASKAAFLHLSRMLSTTFAPTGVRVNVLAPGIFPTEMTAGSSGPDQKSSLEKMAMPNVAGRPGQETDIAATILLLAGRGGSFYYNQILHPDGGETFPPSPVPQPKTPWPV